MNDGFESARERRNFLERLGEKIPGLRGFLDRETRREVDKMERDWIASQVDRAREALQKKIREWSRRGNLSNLDIASSAEKALDRLGNRIRHADYGYTGFFDAVKVYEDELDRLYEFDLGLIERVETLIVRVEALPGTAAEPQLETLLETIRETDRLFDERATIFEDVTRKGGR